MYFLERKMSLKGMKRSMKRSQGPVMRQVPVGDGIRSVAFQSESKQPQLTNHGDRSDNGHQCGPPNSGIQSKCQELLRYKNKPCMPGGKV